MIEETEFLRSVNANIQSYQDKLAELPADASVLRNIIHGQIQALHKLKADVLLGRDTNAVITPEEAKEGEEYLLNKVEELWKQKEKHTVQNAGQN